MVRVARDESLRKKVYDLWVENPYWTASKICRKLAKTPKKARAFYKQHGNYINKLLSEFRSYPNLGSPQKAQDVPHKRVFVWENVPRKCFVEFFEERFKPIECVEHLRAAFRSYGWETVANRNQMLIFRDDRGSVHWYKGGLVRLYLRGAVQLARAKELFCKAFSFLGDKELMKYLDVPLRETKRHWVFELGASVPRFDIRKFERTHGLRIYADRSHPTAIEIEETTPFWIGELRQTLSVFGESIAEHLNLIKEWQQEAKEFRHRQPRKLSIGERCEKLAAEIRKRASE